MLNYLTHSNFVITIHSLVLTIPLFEINCYVVPEETEVLHLSVCSGP